MVVTVRITARALILTTGYCVHISHVLVSYPNYRIPVHVRVILRVAALSDNFWNLIPGILLNGVVTWFKQHVILHLKVMRK